MGETLARRVRREMLAMGGVSEFPSQFADRPAFWAHGREIAHFERGAFELRLTRAEIARANLRNDERATLRGGDWVVLEVKRAADVAFVLDLVATALRANAPKPGERRRAMPNEHDLARRRRTHGAPARGLDG